MRGVNPEQEAFCRFAGGRLPTGAEWGVAAMGNDARRFPWGATGLVCRRAAYGLAAGPCAHGATGPELAASRPDGATPEGALDLSGNVAEWTREARGYVARGGSFRSTSAAELKSFAARGLPSVGHHGFTLRVSEITLMLTVAILCTGSELTLGELVNTNATWLAASLTALGFEVAAIDAVADDRSRIREALERLARAHTAVICTGGLGPTSDDLTSECVAELLGVPLVRDPDALEEIRARMHRFGRAMAASNAKQADFPAGATVLPNARGTAPGFSVRLGQALAFFLPGVPSEMKAMFDDSVAPELEPLERPRQFQVRLGTYGLAESEVNDRLAGIEAAHDVVLGYRASIPTIEVKVLARAATTEVARVRAQAAAAEVRKRLGDVVFTDSVQSFPAAVLTLLEARGMTLAVAESCTGGLVSELLTGVPGSSKSFVAAP